MKIVAYQKNKLFIKEWTIFIFLTVTTQYKTDFIVWNTKGLRNQAATI